MKRPDKPVWSNDPQTWVRERLLQLGGDKQLFLKAIFRPPCNYELARLWSTTVASCLGMTPTEFMSAWRKLKGKTDGHRLNEAIKEAEALAQTSSDKGSKSVHGIDNSD